MMVQGSWETGWRTLLGVSAEVPGVFVAIMAVVLVQIVLIAPLVWLVIYFERKLGADFQARIGPNQAGTNGIIQPLADFSKLWKKGSVQVGRLELLVECVLFGTLMASISFIPLGTNLWLTGGGYSLVFPVLLFLLIGLWLMVLGVLRGTIDGVLGGTRSSAKAITAAFSVLISLLVVAVHTGGLKWTDVSAAQGGWPFQWLAFQSPFLFVTFLVFMVSGLVALSVPPFDSSRGVALMEYRGDGVFKFSGIRLGLFFYSRTYAMIMWCLLSTSIFLGGWKLPTFFYELPILSVQGIWAQLAELVVLLLKTTGLVFLLVWISRVSLRQRTDQITDTVWRFLSPIALLMLLGTLAWESWRHL